MMLGFLKLWRLGVSGFAETIGRKFPTFYVERVQSGFILGSKVFEEWVLLKSDMLCAVA